MKKKKAHAWDNLAREAREAREGLVLKALEDLGPVMFPDLFDRVCPELRKMTRSKGEEILRIRLYEELQNMVVRGEVNKRGRKYSLPAKVRTRKNPSE